MAYSDPTHGVRSEPDVADALMVPSAADIATLVVSWRHTWGWKRETLAQFAAVSLSTIERIERGEPVSTQSLDRVAVALGFAEGDFHRPRRCRSPEESLAAVIAFFDGKMAVPCAPLKTQPQAAALIDCHASLIDDGRCSPDAADVVANLRENFDFYSFVLGGLANSGQPVKKREVYTGLLSDVLAVERRGYAALHATYQAGSRLGPISVGIIAFFPKLTDPGAAKRRHLFVPARFG